MTGGHARGCEVGSGDAEPNPAVEARIVDGGRARGCERLLTGVARETGRHAS